MSAHVSLPGCDSEQGHCITCSDEGVRVRVLHIDGPRSLAICVGAEGGATGTEEVAIDLVQPVAVEDLLLVHAGVALANLGGA